MSLVAGTEVPGGRPERSGAARRAGPSPRCGVDARASVRCWTLAAAVAIGGLPPANGASAAPATLWVIQPPGEIVSYDPATFARTGGLRLPAVAVEHPERLTINRRGQMLASLAEGGAWLWDGAAPRTLVGGPAIPHPESAPGADTATTREWLLGADGSLFVVEHRYRTRRARGPSQDTVETRVRIDRTSLDGRPLGSVLDFAFDPCACATGVCSETCPAAQTWAPGGVVDGWFFLTHWVEGQLESSYGPSFLCRTDGRGWSLRKVRAVGEAFLDAVDRGSLWVESVGDGGCCGWDNVGSDRTVVASPETSTVLFDEWSRYGNPDYDVSFFVGSARIAPDHRRVALEFRAGARAGDSLRLSDQGRADSPELASIQRSLAELPVVEVHTLGSRADPALRLTHAELVGWSGRRELLVVERGRLVGVDVRTGRRRQSGIAVRTAADAFLVRR